jgi:transformation/transcription domain-associated protein
MLYTMIPTCLRTFLVEEKCRFLSNFSLQTAEVELPGELLLPKVCVVIMTGKSSIVYVIAISLQHSHYYVRIARFMPRVEVVHKHNTAARRMYIRGHNGKTYPYLVVNDSGLGEARREERVLQLLRLLNHFLGKQKASFSCLYIRVPLIKPSVTPSLWKKKMWQPHSQAPRFF